MAFALFSRYTPADWIPLARIHSRTSWRESEIRKTRKIRENCKTCQNCKTPFFVSYLRSYLSCYLRCYFRHMSEVLCPGCTRMVFTYQGRCTECQTVTVTIERPVLEYCRAARCNQLLKATQVVCHMTPSRHLQHEVRRVHLEA